MTREEAIAKSIEMYPVFMLGNIVDVNEQIRAAYMRGFDDGFHGINQERREAFIEGYTLCQEEGNTANGAIPYESLSEGIKASMDSIESSLQCSSFEKDKYTSATQCRNCGREVWQHRQPLPNKPVV